MDEPTRNTSRSAGSLVAGPPQWVLLTVLVAAGGCSEPPPDASDSGNDVGGTDTAEEVGATADATLLPSLSDCVAAKTVEACEEIGCVALADKHFYEYTDDAGCREGTVGTICVPFDGGDARTTFYWRERDDGVFVVWSHPDAIWPYDIDDGVRWKDCFESAHGWSEVCTCHPRWEEDGQPRESEDPDAG